ncbi:MAG: DUF302 domain-containing protein [Gemmatimonadota bacterium]
MRDVRYSARRELRGVDYEDAIRRATEALGEQGFGVLTEIDVRKTLKEKIGEDFKRYVILGACNPHLAHRALSEDDNVGLLLPCNVVVAETERGSEVAYARPAEMLGVADNPALEPLAEEAEALLSEALEKL